MRVEVPLPKKIIYNNKVNFILNDTNSILYVMIFLNQKNQVSSVMVQRIENLCVTNSKLQWIEVLIINDVA